MFRSSQHGVLIMKQGARDLCQSESAWANVFQLTDLVDLMEQLLGNYDFI